MSTYPSTPTDFVPLPKWWTQGYSAALVAVVIANLVANGFVLSNTSNEIRTTIVIGHLLAQVFLLGFWLAFGGLPFVVRFFTVVAIFAVGAFTTSRVTGSFDPSVFRLLSFSGGTIVLGTHAVLLPLRWLLGWRVDFDRAFHPAPDDRSMQLRLIHLLGLTAAWALPFGFGQAIPMNEPDLKLLTAAFGAAGLVGSFPIAIALVCERRWWFWALIAIGLLLLSSLVGSALGFQPMLFANLGMAVTLAVNLGLLRPVGLRLFSVKQPARVRQLAATPSDAELAVLLDAWPSLDEGKRRAILDMAGRGIAAASVDRGTRTGDFSSA
jgi:hypothetical protein